MGFKYEIYKTQRVCPIRFQRLVTGKPWLDAPDIDDRGYFRGTSNLLFPESDRGPVVGITQGEEITVAMVRERIDARASLFATSSNETVMTCAESKSELPKSRRMSLKIKAENTAGASGVLPKGAKLQIRYGSQTGVIIGELSVWVFEKLTVNLTPHLVSIFGANGIPDVFRADINPIIELVKAYWQPCGIVFRVNPIVPLTENFANPGQALSAEVDILFNKYYKAGTINAYFVRQTEPDILGWGMSRAALSSSSGQQPGILVADATTKSDGTLYDRHTDIHSLADTLAHEIGHFLGLEHVDNRSPNDNHPNNYRDDTWSRRNVMHNYNPASFTDNPPKGAPEDVGYGVDSDGDGRRGALITLKKLVDANNNANHITDPQYFTARDTIKNSPAGLY